MRGGGGAILVAVMVVDGKVVVVVVGVVISVPSPMLAKTSQQRLYTEREGSHETHGPGEADSDVPTLPPKQSKKTNTWTPNAKTGKKNPQAGNGDD